jgi:multicomponent Na+:H+ antiporter subunit B
VTPIVELVAPRLLPIAVVVAVALIVKGYADVGDGFGAGVIVALAIGLRYIVLGAKRADRTMPLVRRAPLLAAAGLLVALAFGFGGVLQGEAPFTHYPPHGEAVIRVGTLELTTAVGFDVGVFMLVIGAVVLLIRELSWLASEDER